MSGSLSDIFGQVVGVAPGLQEPGNINLAERVKPLTQNSDGSYSTLYSMSFEDENGKNVLIPSVIQDKSGKWKIADQKEAIDNYYRTGQHLGKFDTPENADNYAVDIHNRLADAYQKQQYGSGPDAPLVQQLMQSLGFGKQQ